MGRGCVSICSAWASWWTCRVKGSDMRDFGGGSLEQLGPWLEFQWPGLALGVPSCTGPPGTP